MLDFLDSTDKLVVCDFFAHWCGPCKMQTPIINKLEEKYLNRVIFKKIDIDIQQEIAQKYNIMSIPTIVFLYNDQEICTRLNGFTSEETLCSVIDELLQKINKKNIFGDV